VRVKHHIFPKSHYPQLRNDPRNIEDMDEIDHIRLHSKDREKLTFEIFDRRSKEPGWVDWASSLGSKLFTKWLERLTNT